MKLGISTSFCPMNLLVQTIAVVVLALAVTTSANAVTITVNSTAQSPGRTGDCTLGEAIRAANTDRRVDGCPAGSGADTITLPNGMYTLVRVDNNTPSGPNGLPSITSAITINGTGAATTTIARSLANPDMVFRIFHVASGGTLTLNAVTITGGLIRNQIDGGLGIFNNNGGTVRITNSIVTGNQGEQATHGGGISNHGTMLISSSTVSHNFAGRGGANGIGNSGILDIANSAIVFNQSGSAVSGGTGGIGNSGTLTITNSTLGENTGINVGGIRNDGGAVNISNSTVSRNEVTSPTTSAGPFVGGIFNSSTTPSVGTVRLQNTILIRNESGQSFSSDCFGTITSLGNNFVSPNIRTSGTSDPSDDCQIVLQPSDLDGDPGIGTIADTGMPGQVHFPLLPTSRAIDAGSNNSCLPTDQLGRQRACLCDIGAVEFPPAQTVDVMPGDVGGLINAITAANMNSAYSVIHLGGTYNLGAMRTTPNGPTGLPSIASRICLKGTGPETTTIQRDSTTLFRIFHVAPSGVLTLNDLTIRNGNSPDSDSGGGGIFNNGMLTMVNITVSHNRATGGSDDPGGDGKGGGGISNVGTATLTNTTIRDNESTSSGGGIENFRTSGELGRLILINSIVSTNSAEFDGGGFENSGSASVSTSTFNDNRAKRFGGAINNFSSSFGVASFDLTNSTINNNTADLDGGGFENSAQAFLINSTISGNIASQNGSGIGNFPTEDTPGFMVMNNVTITRNRPRTGNVAAVFNARGSIINVLNTLITQNTSGDCEGTFTSRGFNLVGTGCSGFNATGDQIGSNPMLDTVLRDNGGATRTHALLPGSPAIDMGNPATPGASETACEPTDQRGFLRPADGPDPGDTKTCDIGAFEFGMRVVNSMVQFAAPAASAPITADTSTCPFGFDGEFRLVRRLTNAGTRPLSDLIVEVETLTNGNILQKADEGPAGRGARLSVPREDGFSDGVLSRNEFVDVPFVICLKDRNPFRFFVDVFGMVQ